MHVRRTLTSMACRRGCAIAALVVTAACGPVVAPSDGGDDDDTGSDATSGDDDASASATMTAGPTTTLTSASATDPSASASASVSASNTATMTDPSATDPSTASVTITDPSFTATDSDPTDTSGGLPNGSACELDEECESGSCYVVQLLGGLCGECKVDADCPGGGCTLPNPFAMPPTGSVCNDGGYGAGCMSDDACADDLQCATVIDVPGIIAVSTCGECIADADCDVGSVCAPDIALVGMINGVNRCVAEGSLSNGQSCDYATSGDLSCASGHCAVADVMGFLLLGVCSECEADEDCLGLSCEPPIVDLDGGLFPGTCGP
jgi:hypothetical protein